MIKFSVGTEVTLNASVRVDGDGDLELSLDGKKVLYICSEDGCLYRYCGNRSLESLGIKVNAEGRIAVSGVDEDGE